MISQIMFVQSLRKTLYTGPVIRRFASSSNPIVDPPLLFGALPDSADPNQHDNDDDVAPVACCQLGDAQCTSSATATTATPSPTASCSINTSCEDAPLKKLPLKLNIPRVPAVPRMPKNTWRQRAQQDGVFHSHGITVHMPGRLKNPVLAKSGPTGMPQTTNDIGGDIRILDFRRDMPTKYWWRANMELRALWLRCMGEI